MARARARARLVPAVRVARVLEVVAHDAHVLHERGVVLVLDLADLVRVAVEQLVHDQEPFVVVDLLDARHLALHVRAAPGAPRRA